MLDWKPSVESRRRSQTSWVFSRITGVLDKCSVIGFRHFEAVSFRGNPIRRRCCVLESIDCNTVIDHPENTCGGLYLKTFNLFISHSWSYSTAYDNLVNLLNERTYFSYRNYSVPIDDPIHNASTDAQLRSAIRNQISPSSVVIILAGVYSTYSKWINVEIDLAQNGFTSPKPILAIRPRGSERISSVVRDAADEVVGWNTESVVGAIRRLG